MLAEDTRKVAGLAEDIKLEETKEGIAIPLRVAPRSSRNCLDGVVEGELRLRVTAAPVEGAANAAIIALLAKQLGIAKGQVSIIGGETSRHKRVLITGVSQAAIRAALLSHQ
ncbi:MAG: DUF167 family protein [Chloroflexi bacterium]|nr:DUF167 family protein [Chloroflexota bacterium]